MEVKTEVPRLRLLGHNSERMVSDCHRERTYSMSQRGKRARGGATIDSGTGGTSPPVRAKPWDNSFAMRPYSSLAYKVFNLILAGMVGGEDRAIGNVLRDERDALGLKQEELAALMNRPQSFVSKTETGERPLRLREYLVYARALNADLAELTTHLDEEVSLRDSNVLALPLLPYEDEEYLIR